MISSIAIAMTRDTQLYYQEGCMLTAPLLACDCSSVDSSPSESLRLLFAGVPTAVCT